MSLRRGGGTRATSAVVAAAAALTLGAAAASAARPVLADEATYGSSGGNILVHYATSGADAAAPADTDSDGVPDFVAEVAQTAEGALTRFLAMGFRRPLSDGAEGGDARIDIYLRNLVNSDGSAGTDSCIGLACVGYAISENDFVGYSYVTVTEGIRSVVPHELFHLVQMAYAAGQTASWSEGSAVWAVEELYGNGNSDFERFLASFLTKSFRPFDRAAVGFGDGYPYGAALWAYFLSRRYDPKLIADSWTASATLPFLDAIGSVLTARGSTVEAAYAEMTRWNWFTGGRASGGRYADASTWPQVSVEPAFSGVVGATGKIYIEGLSARYVPVSIAGAAQHLVVAPTEGIKVGAWVVAEGATYAQGVELVAKGQELGTTLQPGAYTLVVTGLTRNTIATAVNLALREPPPPPEDPEEPDEDGGGGCQATSSATGSLPLGFLLALGVWRRRRKAARN